VHRHWDDSDVNVSTHVLDNPVWLSLHGEHAPFAEVRGEAARYHPDVAPFAAILDNPTPACWSDLVALFGAGAQLVLVDAPPGVPESWQLLGQTDGVQLVGEAVTTRPDAEAVPLGPDDVPAMLRLVDRTKPGPFAPRTIELGRYIGVWIEGELVAMAGERLHPQGWTEISAVCTDERFRGRGLASRLILDIGHGIRARGEIPFLHASAQNTNAIRLYESMGFVLRRKRVFTAWRLPGPAAPAARPSGSGGISARARSLSIHEQPSP
jgi:ribosomal protein S18 acetylase RimI-like enzyme